MSGGASMDRHGSNSMKKSLKKHGKRKQHQIHASPDGAKNDSELQRKSSHPHLQPSATSTKDQDESPFLLRNVSLYLPLPPVAQADPVRGICTEHLSPMLLSYFPPLGGTILSYRNVQVAKYWSQADTNEVLDDRLTKSVDEYGACFAWIAVEFLVFRPNRGSRIRGWVNVQDEGHVGLLCWNLFNASIKRDMLPNSWRWVDSHKGKGNRLLGQRSHKSDRLQFNQTSKDVLANNYHSIGHYVNGDEMKIEGYLDFRVTDIEMLWSADRERSLICIAGAVSSSEGD